MKRVVALIAAAVLVVAAGSANAADREISKSGLAKMGIPGLKVMSDAEGSKVRGTAAFAFSFSRTSAITLQSSAANESGSATANPNLSAAASLSGAAAFGLPGNAFGLSGGFGIAGGF